MDLYVKQFILNNLWIIILLIIWSASWKGVALWKAAQNKDKKWFIILLVVNTLAILEIFYIFVISKKNNNIVNR